MVTLVACQAVNDLYEFKRADADKIVPQVFLSWQESDMLGDGCQENRSEAFNQALAGGVPFRLGAASHRVDKGVGLIGGEKSDCWWKLVAVVTAHTENRARA